MNSYSRVVTYSPTLVCYCAVPDCWEFLFLFFLGEPTGKGREKNSRLHRYLEQQAPVTQLLLVLTSKVVVLEVIEGG